MHGMMRCGEEEYPITRAELHMPMLDDSRMLYLAVYAGSQGGFGLWDIEIPLLERLEELDGKRLHVYWGGEVFPDDTLGTDVIGAEHLSDLNYWQAADRIYTYQEIQADFRQLQGREYRCQLRCVLTPSEGVPGANGMCIGTADFSVLVDEDDQSGRADQEG